jgi:Glycosyl hydrolases family 25
MVPACDISKYQGAWPDYPCDIILIKMSGGDNGLYMDSDAATNYNDAKAAGKSVGGYHFIGWALGAVAEATYFMQAMSPLAENDVYALDIEAIPSGIDPVAYVSAMISTIHSRISVWPLVYMNLATLNAYNWDGVLVNCGLWLADWNNDPNATLPTVHTYVMQQYSDGPIYDHDEWFGPGVDSFNAYGWHEATATPLPPTPTPAPEPAPPTPAPEPEPIPPAPEPTPEPEPTPPEPQPEPSPAPDPEPEPEPEPPVKESWLTRLIDRIEQWWSERG